MPSLTRPLFPWFAALAFFPTAGPAQTTISGEDYCFQQGTQLKVYFDNTQENPVDVGRPGGPHTWKFSIDRFPGGRIDTHLHLAPTDTPFADNFPTADHVVFSKGQPPIIDVYFYHRFDLGGLRILGMGGVGMTKSQNVIFDYEPDWLGQRLPLHLGETWTTNHRYTHKAAPGLEIEFTEVHDYTVDGWGQLVLPVGTFDCLRLFIRKHVTQRIKMDGRKVGGESESSVIYRWVTAAYGVEASCESLPDEDDPDFQEPFFVSFTIGVTPSTDAPPGRAE